MLQPDPARTNENQFRTRRRLVAIGGVTLVATTVLGATGCASALSRAGLPVFPRAEPGPIAPQTVAGVPVGTLGGGTKPIFVAPPGNLDPVAHSVADTLFWGEQMAEHAMFFAMMMPGPELAAPREEAERFQRQFTDHLARLRGARLDRGNYVAFNNQTTGLIRALADYKQRMEQAQATGRMRSLAWPSFFDHTRKEAIRFGSRLAQLNGGNAAFDRREVVPFWADKMEEHSLFIAHLLDPDEKALIEVSETSAKAFARLEAAPPAAKDPALAAAQTIIDFKTAAEKGILAGEIKSIIHPALADHVRREAVRFKDELARAA
jgi:hypothetical protein